MSHGSIPGFPDAIPIANEQTADLESWEAGGWVKLADRAMAIQIKAIFAHDNIER